MSRFSSVPLPAWPAGGASPETLAKDVGAWAGSAAMTALVEAFGGRPPYGELATQLAYLEDFSAVWDFRGGAERFAARYRTYDDETTSLIYAAGEALGLIGPGPSPAGPFDHVLVLGGGSVTGRARALHAAEVATPGAPVVGLGSLRELPLPGPHATEGDAMIAAMTEAFPPEESETVRTGDGWWIRGYTAADHPVHVIAAPPTRPGQRANTADTLLGWMSLLHTPTPSERVLLVTTDLYTPFQHADAITTIGLTHRCGIETTGFTMSAFPHWPKGPAQPGELLQETRSAITSMRRLITRAA